MELPVAIDDLRIEPDYPNLIAALEKCEFKSLLQEVRDEAAERHAAVQGIRSVGVTGNAAVSLLAANSLRNSRKARVNYTSVSPNFS